MTEEQFKIFDDAYQAIMVKHHGTEPLKARRAGAEALIAVLSVAQGCAWQMIETARHKDGARIMGWDGKQQFTCYFRGEHHLPHQDKPGWFDQHIRMHPTHWKPLGPSPVPSTERSGT